ncbi:MAG: helix-turn-helix domain-containing protein [Pyrinomonadaceae bacterium]
MKSSFSADKYQGTLIRSREVSGLNLAEEQFHPNSTVPSHSHEQALFRIVLDGKWEEKYGGKIRKYEPVTSEFLPSNHDHSLSFSRVGARAFSIEMQSCWLEREQKYSLNLKHSVFGRTLVSSLLLRAYREFQMSDSASALAIEGLALEMLAEVSRRNLNSVKRTPPRWIDQVIDLLHSRFQERLTIGYIAANVNIHPVHLAREFHRFERCTVGQYIRRLRVEQTCLELSSSNEPLAAIAARAGFSDQSHFCRTFKLLIGTTPIEYRTNNSRH